MPRHAISDTILPPLAPAQIAGKTGEAARRYVDTLECLPRDATAAADPSHGLAQCRLIEAAAGAEALAARRAAGDATTAVHRALMGAGLRTHTAAHLARVAIDALVDGDHLR